MVQNSIPQSDPKPHAGWMRIAAVMFGLMLAVPVGARAASCPAGSPGALHVNSFLPQPEYRHSKTRPQIGALSGRGHMSNDRSHAGLTQTQTSFTLKPTMQFQRLGKSTVCASIRDVEVSWRMVKFIVDIAAEYRRGSCPYNEIVRHENQHVDISQRAFVAADRDLRQQLAEALRRQPAFALRGTPQQAVNEAAASLMAVAKPILEKYDQDTRRQNAAIDTPESYRAVSARCRDW